MNAALSAARGAQGDVHLSWEPLTFNTESSLANRAFGEYLDAHDAVSSAAQSTHTGSSTPFQFWRFTGGGWNWVVTQTNH